MKTNKVHKYWDNQQNPSMEDKYLLDLEISLIKKHLGRGKILDAGCGEGETTRAYSKIKGVEIQGIDYSETRLKMARKNCPGVVFKKVDLLKKFRLEKYDFIVSQRCLINLKNWQEQKKVIKKLIDLLKPKGKLLLLEGSQQGADELNKFRAQLNLGPIPIRWHNQFINDNNLRQEGFNLVGNLGGYFLLTRGVKPYFKTNPKWNDPFNKLATRIIMNSKYSRIKLWKYIHK